MCDMSFAKHMCKNIGETVTIFTESGGDSGQGFTGILLDVTECYVRLTTQVGPAPGCSLGNCCSHRHNMESPYDNGCGECDSDDYDIGKNSKFPCKAKNVGSISDIPICKIVAFVHNSLNN
ncbi:hypothetical protein [Clostridium massiliodielmoense]|uniref:hypothetical protein n=1 Tax=Clostridium massiliodielmoense TaxID=1776385 RepID=UPI0004D5E729|nr:hypothetical protein [Clostridium massiliodielmoense]KEH99429.1 hypothetical protein Z962_00545 [Clostridium botulinum C/D str. BKT12695]